MPLNYVVLRRSPDWTTFDIEETRVFLANIPLPSDMIVRFSERWDDALALGYTQYRQAMKNLSIATARAVRNSTFISIEDLPRMVIGDADRLFFTDDDDWVSPHLFERLSEVPSNGHGWLWRSIRVGKLFGQTPLEGPGSAVVVERPASETVFTNNYAVTGEALKRLGLDVLVEHYNAQLALNNRLFTPVRIDDYLSAANKHLCCTVCIHYNSLSEAFQADMASGLRQVVDELDATNLSAQSAWIADALEVFKAINRQALQKT